eukprot:12429260-Karenia_brevis.AAC.1
MPITRAFIQLTVQVITYISHVSTAKSRYRGKPYFVDKSLTAKSAIYLTTTNKEPQGAQNFWNVPFRGAS